MSRTTTRIGRVVISCLIVANVITASYLYWQHRIGESNDKLKTIIGMTAIDGRKLAEKNELSWLVELVDPADDFAISKLREVLFERPRNPFTWVIITSDPDIVAMKAGLSRSQLYFLNLALPQAGRLLGQNVIGSHWLVYDSMHTLRAIGDFVHGGLLGALLPVVDGNSPLTPELLRARFDTLKENATFVRLRQLALQSARKRNSALFINDMSSGCPVAGLVYELNTASHENPSSRYSVVVPATWNDDEIAALKTNFDITADVVRADGAVDAEWRRLTRVYGIARTNGLLVVLASDGITEVVSNSTQTIALLRGSHDGR
jgi:hypothetical protein